MLSVVFDDNQATNDVMTDLGITDRRALTKLTSSPEALKKARYKNGDPKGDELLDEDSFEEVQLSTSYPIGFKIKTIKDQYSELLFRSWLILTVSPLRGS